MRIVGLNIHSRTFHTKGLKQVGQIILNLHTRVGYGLKTVLIIDDEEKLRSLLSRIIRSEGFEVIEAADCRNGLKKTENYDIDVVLSDVKLPDGNG